METQKIPDYNLKSDRVDMSFPYWVSSFLISLAIQIPYVQNKLTQKAITFLENKIGTDVNLERISLSIPKKIVLTGLYLEDQKRDTLLYAGELAINTDFGNLTQHTIQLNDIELTNFHGFVSRAQTATVLLTSATFLTPLLLIQRPPKPDTTQTPWKFSIGAICPGENPDSF